MSDLIEQMQSPAVGGTPSGAGSSAAGGTPSAGPPRRGRKSAINMRVNALTAVAENGEERIEKGAAVKDDETLHDLRKGDKNVHIEGKSHWEKIKQQAIKDGHNL